MKKILFITIPILLVLVAIHLLMPAPEKTFERSEEYVGPNTNAEFNPVRNVN